MADCEDCARMNLQDRNKYDEAYCAELKKYTSLTGSCRYFTPRVSSSNCFLTTAYCEIKGYPDDCYELQILRNFRENYISHISEGQSLLEEYMVIGPQIANRLHHDPYKFDLVEEMGTKYIYPAIDFINNNRMEDAKNTYVDMVEMLKVRYGFSEYNKTLKRK